MNKCSSAEFNTVQILWNFIKYNTMTVFSGTVWSFEMADGVIREYLFINENTFSRPNRLVLISSTS